VTSVVARVYIFILRYIIAVAFLFDIPQTTCPFKPFVIFIVVVYCLSQI
jgi:hypothetical protein